MQLRAAEGALEQVGGQYIQERARQAREAVVALEERERELDLDYGAWRLLQEALTEAEQERPCISARPWCSRSANAWRR